jgi:hypothetical protein
MVDEKKKKKSKAAEVAEAMAANMATNMNNPDYFKEHEQMLDDVTKKVLDKRKIRRAHQDSNNEE